MPPQWAAPEIFVVNNIEYILLVYIYSTIYMYAINKKKIIYLINMLRIIEKKKNQKIKKK